MTYIKRLIIEKTIIVSGQQAIKKQMSQLRANKWISIKEEEEPKKQDSIVFQSRERVQTKWKNRIKADLDICSHFFIY